jgi:hypothetical protein
MRYEYGHLSMDLIWAARKEGRKDIVLGTGPGKGSHKTLKSVYHIVHTLWISLYWSYDV